MGDTDHKDETEREPDAPAEEAPAPAQPSKDEILIPTPPSGKEAWRGGSGCGPRLRLYVYIVMAACFIAVLLAGVSVMRRGVWVNLDQGRRAVAENLPHDLPPGERQRTLKNLDRIRALLERSEDPYPVMGEFMTRVRAVFRDGRLTVDEVGGLNVYIERVIEESGVPPLQLGIRNSEFGIRNAASDQLNPVFEVWANSKLKTQNSKLA